jgi:hypothetical protein
LPNGLSLNPSTGAITGTVNSGQGGRKFNVAVTDSQSHSYNESMTIDVVGPAENMPSLGLYWFQYDCTIGIGLRPSDQRGRRWDRAIFL